MRASARPDAVLVGAEVPLRLCVRASPPEQGKQQLCEGWTGQGSVANKAGDGRQQTAAEREGRRRRRRTGMTGPGDEDLRHVSTRRLDLFSQ